MVDHSSASASIKRRLFEARKEVDRAYYAVWRAAEEAGYADGKIMFREICKMPGLSALVKDYEAARKIASDLEDDALAKGFAYIRNELLYWR